ncbi:hypothetical protein ACFVWN_09440 [Nocardiopsis flavescens]|uniref:hypothetical protein n=1 Tax=Nocardiopsis flavescens TaxID=758803 RepID=UPI0036594CC6
MLTLDDRFEALVADAVPQAKMRPFQEPDPEVPAPVGEPVEPPAEEVPKEEEK